MTAICSPAKNRSRLDDQLDATDHPELGAAHANG
jgi:hypothetical protein